MARAPRFRLAASVFALVNVSARGFSYSSRMPLRLSFDPPSPDACIEQRTQADFDAPVVQALKQKQANMDGYCYFGSMGEWAHRCAVATHQQSFFQFAADMEPAYEQESATNALLHRKAGPMNVTYGEGARALQTFLFAFPYDDVYCDANEWTKLPRAQVGNFTFWQSLAESECTALLRDYPDIQGWSMAKYASQTTHENELIRATHKKQGSGPRIEDMRRHAALKCLLGGLGCDMANCAVNFCRTDGSGNMGHGRRDCGPIPEIPIQAQSSLR